MGTHASAAHSRGSHPACTPCRRLLPGLTAIALAGLCVLAGCASDTGVIGSTTPSPSGTPTVSATLGPQPCGPALSGVTWASVVPHFDAASQQVETVTCGDLRRDGQQEALVPVRHMGSGGILDLYVYAAPAGGSPPALLFFATNLYQGSARISTMSTIISSEVDARSCINRNVPSNAGLHVDLYREWQWSGTSFVQQAFPGIFPAFTRFQAEDFQQQSVNAGFNQWALDPVQETDQFAADYLSPSAPPPSATLVTMNGASAQTRVLNFTVNLERALYPDHGIWEVTSVAAQDQLSVTTPAEGTAVTSPISIGGTGYSFEAGNFRTALWDKGNLAVSDQNHCVLGTGTLHSGASTPPAAPFGGTLAYTPTSASQEDALLWVDEPSAKGDGTFAALMLIKLLVG